MNAPLISVIIPTYNRPVALAELLESLSRQTYANFETIIVNDAGCAVDEVAALYPELRIRLTRTPGNSGHVAARIHGLELARGPYIMLCDDDDLLLPGHMELMLHHLHDGEYDLVYCDAEIVELREAADGKSRIPVPSSRRLFAYRLDAEGMRTFSTFIPSGCLYDKSLHDRIGAFDPSMHHYWDWDFMLRALAQARVGRVPVASVLYAFANAGGNQSGDLGDMRQYLDRLADKHALGELPVKNFFLLLEEPAIRSRAADSFIVWDGAPIISRRASD